MVNKSPEFSIIIPALNEEKYIKYPLIGLKKQSNRDFETIVVDGGSEDRTRQIVGNSAKFIVYTRKGAGAGRNRGAEAARGKILVFIDADTMPSSNLLSAYNEAFKDASVIAATGPIYPLEKANLRIRWGYKFVSVWFVRFTIAIGFPSVVGSNFAVRTDTFRKVKGFDPHLLTYEDWDLSMKLKKMGSIVYVKDASVKTSVRRVAAWGVWGYFLYHVINMVMYNLFKKARRNYKTIR